VPSQNKKHAGDEVIDQELDQDQEQQIETGQSKQIAGSSKEEQKQEDEVQELDPQEIQEKLDNTYFKSWLESSPHKDDQLSKQDEQIVREAQATIEQN
jgi:hypothetical protein